MLERDLCIGTPILGGSLGVGRGGGRTMRGSGKSCGQGGGGLVVRFPQPWQQSVPTHPTSRKRFLLFGRLSILTM